MSKHIFLTLVTLLISLKHVNSYSKIPVNLTPQQIDIKKWELTQSISRRDMNEIEHLVKEIFVPRGIDVSYELEQLKEDIRQSISIMESRLKPEKKRQMVRPVFKWGQTQHKVFITMKYSHRFDSPGCLDIDNQTLLISKKDMTSEDIDDDGFKNIEEGGLPRRISKVGSTAKPNNKKVFQQQGRAIGKVFEFKTNCHVADSLFQYNLNFELYDDVKEWIIDKGRHLLFISIYIIILRILVEVIY